jgi:hypothetical protein
MARMDEKRDIRQIDSFTVHDSDTGEECWVGVRAIGEKVLLAISRQSNGDLEITLTTAEAKRLAQSLS